jgi:hypothetical protein
VSVSFDSVPNSRMSVPISAGFDTASRVAPVLRLMKRYGIPVRVLKAGSSASPRLRALSSSAWSWVSW